jgi:hypothetical protein
MKKALFFAGLAAALSLTGCNKEADVKGLDAVPCELILSNAETRTVNAGMSTAWAENDELNVFYAPAGTDEYSENTKFVVDDPATNHASGTAELLASAYDWYLLYPYDSHIKTPANTSAGYLTVGSKSNGVQTQNGPDDMAHLAGKNLPVYGVAKNVPADEVPVVAMKQVASVVAVNLTNDTDKPLSVSTVSFTAPEDIVGTYYIDFSGDELSFKDSGSSYVSSTATLSVTGSGTIGAGSSAKFYIAVKPFTAKAGDELKLTVMADQGEVEKTVTLSQAYTFASGSIKTLNLSYEAPVVIPTITVADISSAITGSNDSFEGNLEGATVTFVSGANAFIQDETGGILLYQSGHTFQAGDLLSGFVTGTGKVFNGLKEMTSLTVATVTSDQPVPDPVELTLAQLNGAYDDYVSVRVKVKGVSVPTAFSGRNTTMTDGDESLALRDQKNGLTITPGAYDIVGYPSYYNAAQFGVWTQEDIIPVASDDKFFGVSQEQFDVLADATSVQVNVTGNVDWTVEPGDGITSAEPTEGSGEGTVTFTFPANTDTENAKEYSAFIRTAEPSLVDAGTEEFEITITQAKADAVGVHTVTIDFSEQGYENAQEVASATAGAVTFTFDKGTNNNAPKYYTTGTAVRMYGSNSMTVSAEGKTIVSIELGFGSGDGSNAITTDVPTYEEPVWTGEAGSVTFTIGGTSGQRRIKTVTVKYNDTDAPVVTATLESIAVSGQTTEFNVGDTFAFNGTVTATYSNGSTKDVTASATFSEPDMTSAGTREVTVSYTEGEITKTTSYEITVKEVDTSVHTIVIADFESTSISTGVYTVVADKAEGSTAPAYNGTGKDLRIYAKGTLTVSNSKENITKIVFNLSAQGKKRLAPITASTGTVAAQAEGDTKVTWTGDASQVVFTVGDKATFGTDGSDKAGQFCFDSMDVAPWTDGDVPPAKTLESISLSGQKTVFTVNDTYALDGTVTAHYTDGSTKDVTASATVPTLPDMTTAGSKEVTVSYTEGEITKTASYTITVNAASAHTGSADDPFPVAEAVAATEALGLGNTSADFYYTKGIISQIDQVSTDYGNATYFISDDGTTTGQFEVFRGKYLGNINFTAEDQIQVGDEVVVYGKFVYYKSTSTPEIAQGNYLTCLKRNGTALYALNASASQTEVGAAGATVKVSVFGNVAWTASVTGGATVDPDSGSGMGSFNVTIPENTDTEAGKTYTVTVSGTGVEAVTITITQSKKEATSGSITVTAGRDYLAANKDGSLDSVISYTNDSDYGSTTVNELRVYKNKTLTVTASGGHTIKSIVMTCTKNGTTKEGPGCWGSGAPEGYTFESDGPVGTWTGSASTVSFTAKENQVRIVELTVTYE